MTNKRGELLSKAIHIAVNAHHGQFDRGGRPYILHALRVMELIKSDDEELQCIAVLHDTVEDCKDITYKFLKEQGMTDRIIEGVSALTKIPGQTDEEYKGEILSNPDAIEVKMADLTHNSDIRRLKGVRDKDIERMAKYHRFFLELQAAKLAKGGLNGS